MEDTKSEKKYPLHFFYCDSDFLREENKRTDIIREPIDWFRDLKH